VSAAHTTPAIRTGWIVMMILVPFDACVSIRDKACGHSMA
jgi:hypothetical protein